VDLFDVVRSCFRRWYVVLPLMLIVCWFAHSVYSSVKPVYYSSALIGIAPPSTRVENTPDGVPVPRNGLLDTGGAQLIANLTALGLIDPSAVNRVVTAGGLPDYHSKMFPTSPGMQQLPLIMVEETNADPAAVTKTLELVTAQADVTLRNLQHQANVPDDQMVTSFVVSPPSSPAAAMPSRTRSTVSLLVAGLGLSILFAVVLDVVLTRMSNRRKSKAKHKQVVAEVQHEGAPEQAPVPGDPPINSHEPSQGAPVASPAEAR
jgi:hypothetical protein